MGLMETLPPEYGKSISIDYSALFHLNKQCITRLRNCAVGAEEQ